MRSLAKYGLRIIGIVRVFVFVLLTLAFLLSKDWLIAVVCGLLAACSLAFMIVSTNYLKKNKQSLWVAIVSILFVSVIGGSAYLLYNAREYNGEIKKLPLNHVGISRESKVQGLDVIICIILCIYAFLIIFPFWNAFVISISSEHAYLTSNLLLWPTELDLSSYKFVFSNKQLWSGFRVTMILLIGGTAYQLFFTVITGYALSRHNWTGKNFVMNMILVTMFFGGGLIPYFLLIKELGMMNKIWVMIIPGAIDTFNMLLMRNYFASLPPEMEESAKIDGANDIIIFVKVFLPLSLPMLATVGLFFAVGNWNSWYNAMIFMPENSKDWPLQMVLRTMITKISSNIERVEAEEGFSEGLTMACIFFTIVPMMSFYPFLQRFFVKGIVVGAIKG